MKRHNYLFWVLLLVIALALVACTGTGGEEADEGATDTTVDQVDTGADEGEAADTTETETMDEAERKVITFIWTQEFDSLSPLYTSMWFSTITAQLWNDWAWHFDDNNEAFPVLLTEIPTIENGGISEDGTVLTFRLRDDLVWSDGTPMTSEDFIFTYEMVVDPANAVSSTYPYDQIASIEAPDERTVVVTFDEPFVPWLATFWHGILPAHVLRPVFEADGTLDTAEWNLNPTPTAGPYVLDEWESGSFARFVINDNYWGERPKIDEIFLRFVPDDASQIAALQTGDGDLGTFIAYSDIPTLEDAGVGVLSVPSGYNEGLFFYFGDEAAPGHPAVQDVKVRQAFAMALDRYSFNEDVLLGLTKPAATLWDNMPYVDPTIEPWPYDPDMANQLLDEAGWVDTNGDGVRDKDGVELILKYGTTNREIRQDMQAVAQQELAAVGIQLELFSYDADLFFSGLAEDGPAASGELDIFEWSDGPSFPDPDHYYWYCSEIPSADYPDGGNWQRLCDSELDALFSLQTTQISFEDRQQTFYEITRMMFDEVYWLGLWEDPDIWAVSPRLTNVKLSGATPFFNIAEWDISE